MNRFRPLLFQLLVIIALLFSARAADHEALTVKVDPEQTTIPLHQPLEIVLTIENSSLRTAEFDLGDDRKRNIVLTVAFPDATKKICRIAEHEGFARIGKIKLGPGKVYSQHLIVQDWIDFAAPGIYRIEVQLTEPIRFDDGTHIEPIMREVVVNITDPNRSALAEFCRNALHDLLSSNGYAEAQHAAELLSYTRDPVAIPYLERAFESPYPVQSFVVGGLEQIGTDDSIRALLLLSHKNHKASAELISQALTKLANQTSDPDLQVQIKQALDGK